MLNYVNDPSVAPGQTAVGMGTSDLLLLLLLLKCLTMSRHLSKLYLMILPVLMPSFPGILGTSSSEPM